MQTIADAAPELVCLRDEWLNPVEVMGVNLKDRTVTKLYNKCPDWPDLAHKRLDAAVFDAYGWPHDLSDDEILARLLALNLERAKGQGRCRWWRWERRATARRTRDWVVLPLADTPARRSQQFDQATFAPCFA